MNTPLPVRDDFERLASRYIWYQFLILTALVGLSVLNEVADLPHFWFGAPPTTSGTRWAEVVVEAGAFGVVTALQILFARKRVPEHEGPLPTPTPDEEQPAVRIPDYTLLKLIGCGAYGEVWLGRNRVGMYHAVKIVFRKRFSEGTPYEREFRGIRRYMPVSLRHPGLVRVLYVGRNDHLAYFYYIMELGDDEKTGQEINIENYAPRNLAKDLRRQEHLPVSECLALGGLAR